MMTRLVIGRVSRTSRTAAMLDQGHGFMMILTVAIGAANAFAVDGKGLCDVQAKNRRNWKNGKITPNHLAWDRRWVADAMSLPLRRHTVK